MQVPYRKPGKYSQMKTDFFITQEKFDQLTKKLTRLKNSRPEAASEVARLAELGDFSENAEYQNAKWRLRSINSSIEKTENMLDHAVIIKTQKQTGVVALGHTVTVESGGKEKTYQILGSSETNPKKGVISHSSPLGAALLGKKNGENIKIQLAEKVVEFKIIKIE